MQQNACKDLVRSFAQTAKLPRAKALVAVEVGVAAGRIAKLAAMVRGLRAALEDVAMPGGDNSRRNHRLPRAVKGRDVFLGN